MKTPSFKHLWLGQLLANSGDVFYIVGLMAIIHEQTGSAVYLAIVPFIITVAKFSSGFIAPLLLDQYRLKSLLVFSQLGKTLFLFTMQMATIFFSWNLVITFVFVFFISFFDGWATPARNAMLPRLVHRDELVKANSFVSTLDQTVQLGGWASGGIIVALIGGNKVIWLTLSLFILSTFFMQLLRDETKQIVNENTVFSRWESLKEGWLYIWEVPSLRSISFIYVLEYFASAVWIAAILYVYVDEILGKDQAWWGYINATFFLGLVIGGLFAVKFAKGVDTHLPNVIIISSFGICIGTFTFGFTSSPLAALFLSALCGFLEQVKSISLQTSLQRAASIDQLPKIYAAQGTLLSLVFAVSSVTFGFLTELYSVSISFIIAALLLLSSAIYLTIKKKILS
ncbi:MFS transporter [Metabacillus litoralis]|uniref:MFS transporter n=1 Tax=Metabacillus litoralis TaxID=152268 RepID=UPI00203F9D6B|nr:MFS transporter [Metabacillus litoralis]MCM3164899.1 MFS transporter [Metabacillus litoralis]